MRVPADVRDALRGLTHRPAYALVSVLTFAIGIGANLAIFSLANVLLLRPVPGTSDPGRLVRIMRVDRQSQASSPMSYPVYEAMRDGMPALSGLATYVGVGPDFTLPGDLTPHRVRAQLVTGNYFEVVGAQIGAGRRLTGQDDSPAPSRLS